MTYYTEDRDSPDYVLPEFRGTEYDHVSPKAPGTYGSRARLVDISMWQAGKPCKGGECDDGLCDRHWRFDAQRYLDLTRRWKGIAK